MLPFIVWQKSEPQARCRIEASQLQGTLAESVKCFPAEFGIWARLGRDNKTGGSLGAMKQTC